VVMGDGAAMGDDGIQNHYCRRHHNIISLQKSRLIR
jgi:hypothetical protein